MNSNKEIWLAFTTLSDAQTLLQEFGDPVRANDEINHAKIHLSQILESWSHEERSEAMDLIGQECTVKEEFNEFLIQTNRK